MPASWRDGGQLRRRRIFNPFPRAPFDTANSMRNHQSPAAFDASRSARCPQTARPPRPGGGPVAGQRAEES